MLHRCGCLWVRRKFGQKAWSPNATRNGAAPTNGITAQEALQIAYRPMPPLQTVEYEEDFGPNMMIHREFISNKNRAQLSFDLSPMAYSEVELKRAQQQLASVMNRERGGALVGAAGERGDQVFFHADVDEASREVRSARYLFNESRLQYCERFQSFFRTLAEAKGEASAAIPAADDTQYLFSLMEACAILYGCETAGAREMYYRMFMQLDLDSLEAQEETLRNRLADAELVKKELTLSRSDDVTSANVDASTSSESLPPIEHLIATTPSLMPDNSTEEETLPELLSVSEVGCESGASLPDEFEEYAPLYRAYLAHSRGESPIAAYDISTIGSSERLLERRRWRAIMDRLIREEYHSLTSNELNDASLLNQQLHTVKFFDLKIGDTVREIMQLLQRETGTGSSVHLNDPREVSPTHPERRV